MSAKTSPQRRAAFFAALRATGNQTIAAERAKVSRSWVQLHRSTDPAFDGDVRAAIEEAKASLRLGPGSSPGHSRANRPASGWDGTRRPPSGWGHLDGEELVVKGTNGRRAQIARARLKQWTPRIEDRFLAVVAATCNVKAACAEVGMTVSSAYAHRKRWPGFARRWDEAVWEGTQNLEDELMTSAIVYFERPGPGELLADYTPTIGPMSVRGALSILRLNERRAREAEARCLERSRGLGPKWPGRKAKEDGAEG
jgi:hypothetical protein